MFEPLAIVFLLGLWATSLIDNYYLNVKLVAAGEMITAMAKSLKQEGYGGIAHAD